MTDSDYEYMIRLSKANYKVKKALIVMRELVGDDAQDSHLLKLVNSMINELNAADFGVDDEA